MDEVKEIMLEGFSSLGVSSLNIIKDMLPLALPVFGAVLLVLFGVTIFLGFIDYIKSRRGY